MNLVIDIGNTSVKAAIFKQGKIVVRLHSFAEIKKAIEKEKITCSIISKTGSDNPVEAFLSTQKFRQLTFNHHLKLPIVNRYATPETVGTDRLALMCAAHQLFPAQNILCIDTGTCITYNFLTATSEFMGGSIAPGIEMRFKALHHFTANLPLISFQKYMQSFPEGKAVPLTGNSTESAIMSGVLNGIVTETNGIVAQYAKAHPELAIVVTGNGSNFFSKAIEKENHNLPDLQLQGLNFLIEFNS
ncbi:MAG: type III pantothenate kinase [Chitinophagales bacterium]|nr:type III pantothenate kinase [Chitinophagales bacterium]